MRAKGTPRSAKKNSGKAKKTPAKLKIKHNKFPAEIKAKRKASVERWKVSKRIVFLLN